jgi:hypothetical protein
VFLSSNYACKLLAFSLKCPSSLTPQARNSICAQRCYWRTTVISQQHIFPLLDLSFLQIVCSGAEELHKGNSGDSRRRRAGDHRLPHRWGPTASTLRASYHTLCTTKEPSMHSTVAGSAAESQMRAACVPEVQTESDLPFSMLKVQWMHLPLNPPQRPSKSGLQNPKFIHPYHNSCHGARPIEIFLQMTRAEARARSSSDLHRIGVLHIYPGFQEHGTR